MSDFKLVWDLGADEIAYEGLRYYARWFDADEHQQDRWFRQLGYIDSKICADDPLPGDVRHGIG